MFICGQTRWVVLEGIRVSSKFLHRASKLGRASVDVEYQVYLETQKTQHSQLFKPSHRSSVDIMTCLLNKGEKLFICRRVEMKDVFYFTSRFRGGTAPKVTAGSITKRRSFTSTSLSISCLYNAIPSFDITSIRGHGSFANHSPTSCEVIEISTPVITAPQGCRSVLHCIENLSLADILVSPRMRAYDAVIGRNRH